MQKRIKIIVLTLAIVLLGFLREYLFANINWIYLTLVNGRLNGARSEFHFLLEWSPDQILVLKWCLTGIFSLLFFAITYRLISVLFANSTYNRIVTYAYLTLLGISGLLFLTGRITGTYDTLYGVIRTLMGIVQSFLPLMIFVLLFKFLPANDSK